MKSSILGAVWWLFMPHLHQGKQQASASHTERRLDQNWMIWCLEVEPCLCVVKLNPCGVTAMVVAHPILDISNYVCVKVWGCLGMSEIYRNMTPGHMASTGFNRLALPFGAAVTSAWAVAASDTPRTVKGNLTIWRFDMAKPVVVCRFNASSVYCSNKFPRFALKICSHVTSPTVKTIVGCSEFTMMAIWGNDTIYI